MIRIISVRVILIAASACALALLSAWTAVLMAEWPRMDAVSGPVGAESTWSVGVPAEWPQPTTEVIRTSFGCRIHTQIGVKHGRTYRLDQHDAGWPFRCLRMYSGSLSTTLVYPVRRSHRSSAAVPNDLWWSRGVPLPSFAVQQSGRWKRLPLKPIPAGLVANVAIFALTMGGLTYCSKSLRRRWGRNAMVCEACGYSREGLGQSPVCPECGARLDPPPTI